MNFDFTDEQKELGRMTRRLLSDHGCSAATRRLYGEGADYDRTLWSELGRLGLLGAAIPECYGGSGAGYLELCVVAEELGRALAPVPFLSSIVLAAELLGAAANDDQKARWLAKLAAGTGVATVALGGSVIVADGMLRGSIDYVQDIAGADFAILAYDDDGRFGLGIVDLALPGVRIDRRRSLDRSHPIGTLVLDGASFEPMPSCNVENVRRMLEARAAVLIAFEQLGGAEMALELARDYALERHAFGRQIGSFQAIKHMLADMYVAVTLARSNAYYGAWALASDAPEIHVASATARLSATFAYELCSANCIQVHGGIGFTWEMDCHLHYRRSQGLANSLGGQTLWEDRLMTALDSQRETTR